MAIAAVITKVMPSSPSANLKKIEEESRKILEKQGALNISFEQKPIAFGIKAIFIKMAWPEEKSTELIESSLAKIKEVSSVTIEDYRRAFG